MTDQTTSGIKTLEDGTRIDTLTPTKSGWATVSSDDIHDTPNCQDDGTGYCLWDGEPMVRVPRIEMPRYVETRFYTATYTGKGEFYSGIKSGSSVTVREEVTVYSFDNDRKASVHLSIQSLERPGAWLVIYGTRDLVDVLPVPAPISESEARVLDGNR